MALDYPRVNRRPIPSPRSRPARVHALVAGSLFLLSACAGPSRARYAQLLGECRSANREHLRMLKEYESRAEQPQEGVPAGCKREKHGCNTCTVCGDIASCTAMYCGPEQGFGSVEGGLGGY